MEELSVGRIIIYDEVPGWEPGLWRQMPEIIHDKDQIKGFFGPYRWLSNFGRAEIMLDGQKYSSVEIAYQAAKWQAEDRLFFATCSSREAIEYNRQYSPNGYSLQQWSDIKLEVMEFLLEQKFDSAHNPSNYQSLLDTENRYLEETNWWADRFWGVDLAGHGENHLGKLLMQIRQGLRRA